MEKYKYRSITVKTKTGNEYKNNYCDYYIQDGILTVFRDKTFELGTYGDRTVYYKFQEHFPMDNIESIMCIEG